MDRVLDHFGEAVLACEGDVFIGMFDVTIEDTVISRDVVWQCKGDREP